MAQHDAVEDPVMPDRSCIEILSDFMLLRHYLFSENWTARATTDRQRKAWAERATACKIEILRRMDAFSL